MSKRGSYRERINQTLQRTSPNIVTSDFTEAAGDLQELELSLIELRSQQPRRQLGEEAFRHLQESIKSQGVLQPIVVHQKAGGVFELVAGERRWRASKSVGLSTIPARVVSGYTEQQLDLIAAMENLQREDLNPVDEADAILHVLANELDVSRLELPALLSRLRRIDRSGHNVMSSQSDDAKEGLKLIEKVAGIFSQLAAGNWQSFVANKMGVLKLPEDLLTAVRNGELEYTKAVALRKVKDENIRREILQEAENKSLEELREMIRGQSDSPQEPAAALTARLIKASKRKRLESLPEKKKRRATKLLEELEKLLEEA